MEDAIIILDYKECLLWFGLDNPYPDGARYAIKIYDLYSEKEKGEDNEKYIRGNLATTRAED